MDTLLPMEVADAEVRIRLLRSRYGDLTEAEVLTGLKYSDEYLCFMSPYDYRFGDFLSMSMDYRTWYELLQLVKGDPYNKDACLVYQMHQQDYGQIRNESIELAATYNCDLYAYRTGGNVNMFLFQPKVVTEETLLNTRQKIEMFISYWGSPPVKMSYLAAFPFKFDPNKKDAGDCGWCDGCNRKTTL